MVIQLVLHQADVILLAGVIPGIWLEPAADTVPLLASNVAGVAPARTDLLGVIVIKTHRGRLVIDIESRGFPAQWFGASTDCSIGMVGGLPLDLCYPQRLINVGGRVWYTRLYR